MSNHTDFKPDGSSDSVQFVTKRLANFNKMVKISEYKSMTRQETMITFIRINNYFLGLLASSALYASAPIDGWYSEIFGGYSYLPNNLYKTLNVGTLNNASYDSGYNIGGRIGFKSNPMRYEGELTYITADLDAFQVDSTPQSGVQGLSNTFAFMANVYYDFPGLTPSIEPFVGVGLGFASVSTKLSNQNPGSYVSINNANTPFAYQATLGLTYNFTENFALDLAYRYLRTTQVNTIGEDYQANLATLGIIYRLDDFFFK